jgi:hypothetical protein
MKKILTLALALVALAVFSTVGLTQQQSGSQVRPFPNVQAGPLPKPPAQQMVFQSAPSQLNWRAAIGKNQTDPVGALIGKKLTAQVVGSGPLAIIVIYDGEGQCRLCIGNADKCLKACPPLSIFPSMER